MAQRRVAYQNQYFDISYEKIKPTHLPIDSKNIESVPTIVFLHGWGSDKALMKIAFGKCFSEYEHIYIDMPGFGNSPNDRPLNTQDYAQIIRILLSNISDVHIQEMLIVGHSFGGKVAVLCESSEIILLSSAGIYVPKTFFVRCKIMLAKILNRCGLGGFSRRFRAKDANMFNDGMYQTFKNVVNEDFSHIFKAYKGRASIFWGKKDSATPLFCGEKIAHLITKSRFFALDGDHYFFLKQGELIEKLYRSNQ